MLPLLLRVSNMQLVSTGGTSRNSLLFIDCDGIPPDTYCIIRLCCVDEIAIGLF
jgi:hypothetical protein